MLRRYRLLALLALLATRTAAGAPFDFDAVRALAKERLLTPYAAPVDSGGADLATWPAVHMKPQFAPWTMASRFVPLPRAPRAGCVPTRWHSIQLNGVKTLEYRPQLFDWAAAGLPETGAGGSGFCGFDLLYPDISGSGHVPFARFGGEHWQLTGDNLPYGAAAWLVASLDDSGRAQPVPFTEHWLVRPAAGARQLRVYALAESATLVAAVQLDLMPGTDGQAQVQLALYPREHAGPLLLAPVIGNFVQDEHRPGRVLPLQAERHCVDGLSIRNPAGWIWRPLHNPPAPRADSFSGTTPRGYGLLQRDRTASSYVPGSEHPRQPGVWVEPAGDWGGGQLRLFEQPATDTATHNVQVGFVPTEPLAPGSLLAYTLRWTEQPMPMPVGRVIATRSGAAGQGDRRRYAVDFSGLALPTGTSPEAVVDIGRGGQLRNQRLVANPHTGGWRLMFDFARESDGPVQLRAYLQHDYQAVTETWDYVDLPQ
jgi:glucans biosynthesis protein